MPPESSLMFPVMEYFYTVQGEGANTGKAAFFLRLAGCDVGCVWCDVKESWDAGKHSSMPISAMVEAVKASGAVRVVITGGEPAMYNLDELTQQLHVAGIECYLETSGAYPLTGEWDWVCVSPKKFKKPLDSALASADELKIIVYNESDFSWAEEYQQKVGTACQLFLQPEYSAFNKMVPSIVEFVKSHPEWTISLQTHKIMHIP